MENEVETPILHKALLEPNLEQPSRNNFYNAQMDYHTFFHIVHM